MRVHAQKSKVRTVNKFMPKISSLMKLLLL
jgi:hypothetical protein